MGELFQKILQTILSGYSVKALDSVFRKANKKIAANSVATKVAYSPLTYLIVFELATAAFMLQAGWVIGSSRSKQVIFFEWMLFVGCVMVRRAAAKALTVVYYYRKSSTEIRNIFESLKAEEPAGPEEYKVVERQDKNETEFERAIGYIQTLANTFRDNLEIQKSQNLYFGKFGVAIFQLIEMVAEDVYQLSFRPNLSPKVLLMKCGTFLYGAIGLYFALWMNKPL
jgi:hypothetical protein